MIKNNFNFVKNVLKMYYYSIYKSSSLLYTQKKEDIRFIN